MSTNPYLVRRREQYEALRTSISGIQERAVQENRDLSDDELTSIRSQGEQAKTIAAEIESLTEIETRNRAVADLAGKLDQGEGEPQIRGQRLTGTTQARDRDPGHYRRDGGHSFFGDLFAARSLQDEGARTRLVEHNRALDMANEGPGVIPPVWMGEEFAELARQQRKVANAVRNIPISSAAAISMPKQSAGTDSIISAQTTAEGANESGWFADAWDSAVDTVTPVARAGGQDVSRQMLDSSNPAVDALIYDDLVAAYNLQIEKAVCSALVTAAGTAVSTYATEAAWTAGLDPAAATYVIDAVTDAALAVRSARKLAANVLITAVNRYGSLLKIKDASGRPLIPAASAGLSNVVGRGDVAVDGFLDTANLAVLATDGLPASTYPESILVARAQDTILFESPVLRFRYEEVNGPSAVRLGIWAYSATYVKYSGSSVKRLVVTAAS